MIDIEHADQNRWSLCLDDSVPLDFPSTLLYEVHPWEAEIKSFFEPSLELAGVLAKTTELHLELSRAWWQRVIPVSHVYIIRNAEWGHTPKAGEPATFEVTGEVDSGTEGPKMYWRWHVPSWIKRCRRTVLKLWQ